MKTYSTVIALLISIIGPASFGSGFSCKNDSETLRVKMYNYLHPENGTRNPAILVVSNDQTGTLLKRFGDAIRKRNRVNTVQYIVSGGSAGDGMDFDSAILQVHYKEGREIIASGDTVSGELILLINGEKDVTSLTCKRTQTE